MTYVSHKLTQELYKLSGWETGDWYQYFTKPTITIKDSVEAPSFPRYDLGYLRGSILQGLSSGIYPSGEYETQVARLASALVAGEDRTAELAIELFKQGVLTRGGDE